LKKALEDLEMYQSERLAKKNCQKKKRKGNYFFRKTS